MHEWPESQSLLRFLDSVTRRRRLLAAMSGAASGMAVAAVGIAALAVSSWANAWPWALMAPVIGALIAWWRTPATRQASALAVESRTAHLKNVLVTAEQLLRVPGPTAASVVKVVVEDAARAVASVQTPTLFPLGRRPWWLAASVAAVIAVRAIPVAQVVEWLPTTLTQAAGEPRVTSVAVGVTPPAYSGVAASTVTDPERLTVLEGSELRIEASATASAVRLETAAGVTPMSAVAGSTNTFMATTSAQADGFVAVVPEGGARRLIGVTVTPDRAPVPKVTAPGKDLFLRAATDALAITVEATDDLGLRELRLTYTKAAGAGESFTFTEGEVRVAVTRKDARSWTGTATLPLDTMGLEVGDMVVYRAVASDARPGRAAVESDAFIVEIVSESEAMSEGFSIDDTRDKYAISQQMVILKTERLIETAAKRGTTQEAVYEEAMIIAAMQRSVRAELVFMMGGHFEDEFVEAAHEHEITDGRLDNQGRADLGKAIREMARAAASLTEVSLRDALAAEKLALEAMQRALSRRRFILRTLTQRDAIDDSRRLTGKLADLGRSSRRVTPAPVEPYVAAARQALAQLAVVAAVATPESGESAVIDRVVQSLLTTGGSRQPIVTATTALTQAREAVTRGDVAQARRKMGEASASLSSIVSAASGVVTTGDDPLDRAVRGALADVKGGGGR
jgi:hypothetical protein